MSFLKEEADVRRRVGFLIPIVNGTIYFGQRNTPPCNGMYGPVGGKSESKKLSQLYDVPHFIEKMGGHKVLSLIDRAMQEDGRELISQTAVREFCEEAFSQVPFPSGFGQNDITDVLRLGDVSDYMPNDPKENVCYFHIAKVSRTDFSLSPRELSAMKPITQIRQDEMYPLAHYALEQLRYFCDYPLAYPELAQKYDVGALQEQIPQFWSAPPRKMTAMVGPLTVWLEEWLKRPNRGFETDTEKRIFC